MAKKRSTKTNNNRRSGISITITNRRLLRRQKIDLSLFDDRQYRPEKSVRSLTGERLQLSPVTVSAFVPDRSGKVRKVRGKYTSRTFVTPNTALCVRRKIRREVIMAKTGGGAISKRAPRLNQNSSYVCRR